MIKNGFVTILIIVHAEDNAVLCCFTVLARRNESIKDRCTLAR